MRTLILLYLTFPALLLARTGKDQSYECLKRFQNYFMSYSKGDNYQLKVKCSDDGCPYSRGHYERETESIALPMVNSGRRGVMFYTADGETRFVNMPTSGIKNDETRYATAVVGNRKVCTSITRAYWNLDYKNKTIENVVTNIGDIFGSKYVGYDVEIVNLSKCESAPTINSTSLKSKQVNELIQGSIHKQLKFEINTWMEYHLKFQHRNVRHALVGCTPQLSKKCSITIKERYNQFKDIVQFCAENTSNDMLKEFLNEKLEELNAKAVATQILDSIEGSDSSPRSSVIKN